MHAVLFDVLREGGSLLDVLVITLFAGESILDTFELAELQILSSNGGALGHVFLMHDIIPYNYFDVSSALRAGAREMKKLIL